MKQKLLNNLRLRAVWLVAMILCAVSGAWADEKTFDFKFETIGTNGWSNSYAVHSYAYDEGTVKFTAASKQTGTITTMPVTKGQPVEFIMAEGYTISAASFKCQQWSTKAQTITLHYSTDRGENYTSTDITSSNFTISSDELPTGTNAVKITFSSTSNQIGVESLTLTYTTSGGSTELVDNDFALTDAPKALSFDLYNNASAQVFNYTTSSTGAVTIAENEYATFSINETNKTITVTPTAVTPSAQTITVNQAADETYKAGSATFTLTITDSTPIPTHTATFSVNGANSTQDFEEGAAIAFPANPADVNGKTFVGWVAEAIDGTTNVAPNFVTSATMGKANVTYYAVFATVVSNVTNVTDVLTNDIIKGVENSYGDWNGKSITSTAVYAGNSAGSYNSIQLRSNNSNSGVITTTSGGTATKVVVKWNSNTVNGRTLNVYGSNSAYSAASNLYDAKTQGTLLGSIACGTNTELTIDGDYTFIGVRSSSGALYLDELSITWSSGSASVTDYCTNVAADTKLNSELSFAVTEVNANISEQFEAPTLNAAEGFNGTVEYESSDESVAQIMDGETGELRLLKEGTTTITATFAGNDDYKAGSASYTLTVIDNRIATTTTHENIVLDLSEVESLTQLSPVVKDAENNIIDCTYTEFPPKVSYEIVSDVNGLIGSIDNNSGEITLNEVVGTATIKASYNAFNVSNSYKPSECTFTITVESVQTISEVRTQGTGSVTTKGIVTSCSGTTAYIQDTEAAICVYGSALTVGDQVKVSGTLSTYKGLLEITSPTVTVLSQNNAVTPEVMTIAEINESENQGWLVKIEDATVTAINGQNTTIAQGDNTIVVRGITGVNIAVDDVITLTGNIGCYDAVQIANPTNVTVQIVASISLEKYSINATAAETEGTINVTYNNITDVAAEVNFYEADGTTAATYDWIEAEIDNSNNVYYVISANNGDARTAYMKVYALDDESNDIYSELITVSQEAYVAPVPSINASNVDLTYDATAGEIAYTITNPVQDVDLTAVTTADWISNITVTADKVTFTTTENEGNVDRQATITLSYTGAEDKAITVTQAHFEVDYANLPFEWEGGASEDLKELSGVTANSLGSDYASGNTPYLIKFDGTGDYIQVKTDGRPGVASIGIKMIGGASTSTITVQESSDGEDFSDVEELTISGTQNSVLELVTTQDFASDSRFVRFYFTKGSNVGVGPISITKYSSEPSIIAENVELTFDATSGEIAYTIKNPVESEELTASTEAEWISNLTVDSENNKVTFTTTANNGTERSATITLNYASISKNITVTQAEFIYAALPFIWDDNTTPVGVENSGVATYGGSPYMKFDGTGDYLILTLNEVPGTLTFDIQGNGFSGGTFKVQTSVDGKSYSDLETYTELTSTKQSQSFDLSSDVRYIKWIYTEKVSGNVALGNFVLTAPITVTLNDYGFATFASTYPLDFTNTSDYDSWQVTGVQNTAISFEKIESKVAAGTGVLLTGYANETITLTRASSGSALSGNKLQGITSATEVAADTYFGLKGNEFVKVNAGTIPAGKAVLPASLAAGVKSFTFNFNGVPTGVNGFETVDAENARIFNLAGQRLSTPQKGLNIVNGKKVLVK